MDWEASQTYLKLLSRRGIQPGLERMGILMRAAGNPEKKFKSVHVTGTNGKGSVCATLESVFRHSGMKTGLYTSPHLTDVRERVRVNAEMISRPEFARLTQELRVLAIRSKIEKQLTYFELVTAIAFCHFARRKVQMAVVEIGLGGRLDATNVLPAPDCCVITNIALEHTDFLGNTLESIAREKAGILKSGSIALTGAKGKALSVIRSRANALKIPFVHASAPLREMQPSFAYGLKHGLPGKFQAENLRLALHAIRIVKERGWKISEAALRQGIAQARWPGRFDWRSLKIGGRNVPVLLDGAHNPAAIQVLLDALKKTSFFNQPCLLLFNALKDKRKESMTAPLLRALKVRKVLVPALPTERSSSPESVRKDLNAPAKIETSVYGSVLEAWQEMKKIYDPESEKWILATGSLYLVGESLKFLSRGKSADARRIL